MAEFSSRDNVFIFDISELEPDIIGQDRMQSIGDFLKDIIQGADYDINSIDFSEGIEKHKITIFILSYMFHYFDDIMFNNSSQTNYIVKNIFLRLIRQIDSSLLTRNQATNLYLTFHAIPLKIRNIFDKIEKDRKNPETIEKPIETALDEKIKNYIGPDIDIETSIGKYKIIVSLHGMYDNTNKEPTTYNFPFHSLEFIVCKGHILNLIPKTATTNICEDRYEPYSYPVENGTITMEPYYLSKYNNDRSLGIYLCNNVEDNDDDLFVDPLKKNYEPLFHNIRDAFKNSQGEVNEFYVVYDESRTMKTKYTLQDVREIFENDEQLKQKYNNNFDRFAGNENIEYEVEFQDLMKNIYDKLVEKNIPPEECIIIMSTCRSTVGETSKKEKMKIRRTKRRKPQQQAGKKRRGKTNKNLKGKNKKMINKKLGN